MLIGNRTVEVKTITSSETLIVYRQIRQQFDTKRSRWIFALSTARTTTGDRRLRRVARAILNLKYEFDVQISAVVFFLNL